jgi:hypothetical protein
MGEMGGGRTTSNKQQATSNKQQATSNKLKVSWYHRSSKKKEAVELRNNHHPLSTTSHTK